MPYPQPGGEGSAEIIVTPRGYSAPAGPHGGGGAPGLPWYLLPAGW